jgi:ABC-type dipeptide/oligopeptide/nickel transport system permease component
MIAVPVSLIAFLLMHAVPGGPFDLGERRLPEATRQAQLQKYGLDKLVPGARVSVH